jgi:enolase-phosphatase E1
MSIDRKQKALKDFQGYMWKSSYESGELIGYVYQDVFDFLIHCQAQKVPVYIYSSGSVPAQKLLFGYSNHGNLLPYIQGHFDTDIGSQNEKESYSRIAEAIKVSPSDILFLSDNPREIEAAILAGMQAKIVIRKGNVLLSADDKAAFESIETFKVMM